MAENDPQATKLGPADAGAALADKKRILLVWPVFQALYPRPFELFAQICIAAGRQPNYLFGVQVLERMSLVSAMNLVAEKMVTPVPDETGHLRTWDAMIVFDDDCFPPVDIIPRLLEHCFDQGRPFVAAAGIMRHYPFTTTVAKYYPEGVCARREDGKIMAAGFEWLDDLPQELIEADFCGVPAAIIHRSVFEQIPYPWFGDMDDRGERLTHDVYFCRKAQAAGIKILVDGTLRCGHLVDAPIVTFENRATGRAMGVQS